MYKDWWKETVVYQIYPRSFMDSNNDGIGDIKGIISKLDYLKDLGIGAIWLCPVFKSPNDDNGYDIADYEAIMDEFGTMQDMEILITESKKRGIEIILDMVFNHTSDEHEWFKKAKKAVKDGDTDSQYYNYYIFRKPVDGKEPNKLKSLFSGSAWEYMEEADMYYLHMFSKKQPDLNFNNEEVRKRVADIMIFWLNKGVSGFRLDVIEMIGKEPDNMICANGPHLHEYIREMNRRSYGRTDAMTVGECWSADLGTAIQYTNPENHELSMVFQFEHMVLDYGKDKWDYKEFNPVELKDVINKWQMGMDKGWNSLFLNNHDLPRIVSRYGDDKRYREESAKLFATLMYFLKGTPFIYQGEELGMTNVRFDSIDDYQDIESINMYKEKVSRGENSDKIMKSIYRQGRDNARTPMQWSTQKNAGFTNGTPWIKVNSNYTTINVEDELKRDDSVLNYYKRLIHLRRNSNLIIYGKYEPIEPIGTDKGVMSYRRYNDNGNEIVVICNMSANDITVQFKHEDADNMSNMKLLLSNYSDIDISKNIKEKSQILKEDIMKLRPYEAVVLQSEDEQLISDESFLND